jgi:2-C-methyl-D-erythritol 4-phosphate cytidylyltransferase
MRTSLARALHERAAEQGLDVTDDAALAEAFGYCVRVVDGGGSNLKVTVPDDLPLAAAVLRARAARLAQ